MYSGSKGNTMRVLVCGSRHFQDYELLKETLDGYEFTEIIHGKARGADTLAGDYGRSNGIEVREFPADWNKYGRGAGPIRNSQMLKEGKPELVIAFRAPDSRGTQNMIDQAQKAGVEVRIIDV